MEVGEMRGKNGQIILVAVVAAVLLSGCATASEPLPSAEEFIREQLLPAEEFTREELSVAWEFSTEEIGALEDFIGEFDEFASANDGCFVCELLKKLVAELWDAGSADEEGEIIQKMLNSLWQFPHWQESLTQLVIDHKGKQWFLTWVGYAIPVAARKGSTTLYTIYLTYGQAIQVQRDWVSIGVYFCESGYPLPPGINCIETEGL
jgi:hypothetical protein